MIPGAEHVQRAFRVPVLIAAVLVVPVLILEETTLGSPGDTLVRVANWVLWGVFAAELVALTVVADRKRDVLLRQPLIVLMVVLTPPLMPASMQAVRALRLLQLARLLVAVRLSTEVARRLFSLQGIAYGAVLVVVVALAGGAALAAAEPGMTTWDGVWLAVETMTTVGYGDVVPTTTLARIMAIAIMIVGIGFVSIVTGAFAHRFVQAQVVRQAMEAMMAAQSTAGAAAGAESDPSPPPTPSPPPAPSPPPTASALAEQTDSAMPAPLRLPRDADVLAHVRELRERLDHLERLLADRHS